MTRELSALSRAIRATAHIAGQPLLSPKGMCSRYALLLSGPLGRFEAVDVDLAPKGYTVSIEIHGSPPGRAETASAGVASATGPMEDTPPSSGV